MNVSFTEQALVEQRPLLFRYALLQCRDSQLADDVVQETLLAALQSAAAYVSKAELRTWLIGILKHKIADHWRRSAREAPPLPEFIQDSESGEDDYFQENGHWNGGPKSWGDPEAALKQQEFWAIYELCQTNLPPKMANVFMLRELVGLDADEVCREAGLSVANYWVTMHRARLRLRECLEIRWFNNTKQENHHA
ncbi:MAG: sigma-70 family RNA polymerase sigma factor [Methylobacter sp.]|uniref:RNA polymerase sigma factor n=1 Tax=Candidatus Methylobacter titanis TaxID=3053457 RepID=A0AA43TQH2_9GAMM|nr:sigma-70 family RNA polymerase sigma factor [Candidatus Methylobacter titanis]